MADIKKITIGSDELDLTKKQDKIDSSHKLSADLVDDSSSTHKFTTAADITKLSGIAAGAEVNVQSDWNQTTTTADDYIKNKPTIGNATITIQKNGSSAGSFTTNATSNKSINITVPTTAADVSALPASTKYGASISVSINTTDYKVTTTLKDQDGNTLGTAQVIDLPLESVVVNGSYDSTNKKIVLTLQNGNTVDIPVGDLVAGLQSEITLENKLASDLVDDANQSHKFMTSAEKTKLSGIATGAEVNQNAFSNVKVGSTTVAADTKTDTLELVAGSNVTLTPDSTNDKVTIAATDTTYSDATTSASGLMSASDKTKLNGIATGAEVNVQSDWNQTTTTADDYIKNKPTIPTVNNATLTITQNGTSAGTFTANASSNKTIALTDTTYSAGTNVDITSNTIKTKTLGVEYIVGTQTGATNVWTGVSTDTDCSSSTIYTGKVIIYHLPYAGNSSAATLNLTLPDGTTTGAKNVYRLTGNTITTNFGAGCDIFMVFDGTRWKVSAYQDSDSYYLIRHQNVVLAAAAITSGRICVGNSSGYKMAASSITSDITYPILYAGSNVNSGATSDNFYDAIRSINLQNTKSGWTGTANKMVFLVGTLSGTTFTVDSDVFTQTIPASVDNKVYAPIGLAYSTTQIYFFPTNTYWEYRNGAFRPISSCPTLATVATTGSYNDLSNKPTIPAAQVQSNWTQTTTTAVDYIKNKPTLATVATSGSYNDLSNKPTIPTVNNATLTIQKNGSTIKTFTANASSDVTANITVPTKTSDITNDSDFITSSGSITGNAGTATKLAAGKTIAIGTGATGTATSFDGSSNITIPVTNIKEAYATWGGKNISNDVTPDDMGCIDEFGHNKLAFLPAECIEIKYSTDGGSTWADYGASDANKVKMVSTAGPGFYVGGSTDNATADNIANLKLRVRIAAGPTSGGKVYTAAKKILINVSTQGCSGNKVDIKYRTIANYKAGTETWTTVGTYDVSGGSGWNSIPFAYTFGGSFTSQTSQMGQIEFVFYSSSLGTWGLKKLSAIDFRMIGSTNWTMPSEMARAGHLYTVDEGQNATFPANVTVTGSLKHGSYTYTLPNKTGTVAMTSDVPTVNNATLTIQKNGSNVQTFTANQSTNATANITVPTKTSDITNDSDFATNADVQKLVSNNSMVAPNFDDMTPVKTFTWSNVADTNYRAVYQFDNTGWTQDNMNIEVAYRITVTGTNIKQITDIVDRWIGPLQWPITSVMCRTLSTSAATTGYRYLRATYPITAGLNNNTYKFGQEIANYNATSRNITVEVFKTQTGITWNETRPSASIYTSSSYQTTNAMQPYATRGWIFRAPSSFNANSADAATRVSSYESVTINSSAIKSGEALTNGYLAYQADDGLIYKFSNTTKNMVCDENARIGLLTTDYAANAAIDTRYFRSVTNLSSTQVGYISHDTLALGNRVYLRCTMDSNGKIHSNNYLSTSMASGYTWVAIGTATASNTIYLDTRKPTFYTLDSNGKLTHVNGKAVAGTTYTAGDHINITGSTIKAVDYVHSESPVSTSAVTPVITNDMISNGTIEFSKTKAGDFVQLTMSTTDISAGSALAKGTLYGVYSA